ncbi:putative metalloreductase Fre8 [Aspergillus clavatus NRRL 1]|uniref:ferric-chelate reductase (NADPH) n=1 Tax=Aspergillus clavatus (strain ATCC 1007 / CBS 513.65 / DSM 816 / NCTC 3887 / NRRL 1 / QM 1276 / 107) TaxID=344612 RepID=A1CCC8_ASPCL|nr:metalloreductase, putative [Aspergillus clavatus NRRL 1]EAW12185.1 metalloreductase, putative [Aspergillus clavatus NRRL 1]
MGWPYHIVHLSPDEKQARRVLLGQYGLYSQLSVLVPILGFWGYRLGRWVYQRATRQAKGKYRSVTDTSESGPQPASLLKRWRLFRWWLGDEVAPGWGIRVHWVVGSIWVMWALFLCVHRTGQDYVHLTKRFGIIPVAQLPTHFMLAVKSPFNPLTLIFNTSHEELLPWHRISGRLIFTCLLLHVSLYLNYFIQSEILWERLTSTRIILGVVAFTLLLALISTSLDIVRHRSYRVFTITHSVAATVIPFFLFFHARPMRWYIIETLFISAFSRITQLDTITAHATVSHIPRTSLVQVQIPIPTSKIQRFRAAPGQHVFLSIHPQTVQKIQSSLAMSLFMRNPFSVADVSENNEITLVARVQDGFTSRALDALAASAEKPSLLTLFGPLGCARRFPNLAVEYDRVLLVAGGVGATFVLPIYRQLRGQFEAEGKGPDRVSFVWSMKAIDEAAWVMDLGDGQSLAHDENIKLHLTRSYQMQATEPSTDDSIEMQELQPLRRPGWKSMQPGRPDFGKIVDDLFRGREPDERVAILFCGPAGMGRELRAHVGAWVSKGRIVWWHAETFGW